MKKYFLLLITLFSQCWRPLPAQNTDSLEFAPIGMSFMTQLEKFPIPRYKKGHTLLPNYQWFDYHYTSGRFQAGITDAISVTNSVTQQTILARDFNYNLFVSWGGQSQWNNAWVQLANEHPEWKLSMTTLRSQVGTKLFKQDFPLDHYLQDAQGRFLGWNEGEYVASDNKQWRPTAPPQDYASDGLTVKANIQASVPNLTRNIDIVNDNDEVFGHYSWTSMKNDPLVVQKAGGNTETILANYHANMVAQNENLYSAQFMSLSRLANAKYTVYRLDGFRDYQIWWEGARKCMSQINGQYYSTTDFYVRYPWNWKNWSGPWHGLKWVTVARDIEIKNGDKLFSPFIAAGWDCIEANNVRNAQWLGLLKLLGIYGAEFYYTGYFNEAGAYGGSNPPPCHPNGYIYQLVAPSYVQAVSSHYEDILRQGVLMKGDTMDNYYGYEMFRFKTGKQNSVVGIRKLNNKFVITGTIQPNDNLNTIPKTDVVTINLEGENLTFKITRQGSTYIYDKTNTATKIWYQLDGWHEYAHPSRWTKVINIEAEVCDALTGNRKTYNFNSLNYKTVVSLFNNQSATYSYKNVDAEIKYLFIKGSGTGNLIVTHDGVINNLEISADGWYKLPLGNLQAVEHSLNLRGTSQHEIDSICITNNPNKYAVQTNPCQIKPIATITSNNNSPCIGDFVTLTASANIKYLWNNSETTQDIESTTSGTYTVTVTDANNCTAVSDPFTVTFTNCSTECETPIGVGYNKMSANGFHVYWKNSHADSYKVYCEDSTGTIIIFQKRQYNDTKDRVGKVCDRGIEAGMPYSVWVTAVCNGLESEKSETLYIKIP